MTSKKITRNAFRNYAQELKSHLTSGEATEHSYRPALQSLIKSFGPTIQVTNEPGQKGKGGKNKPDFIVRKGKTPVGYIETKDVNINLDDVEDSNQIARYCEAYPNLIVTDYIEFRRYVKGELRSKIKIGKGTKAGVEITDVDGTELSQFFEEFLIDETFSISSASELAERLAALTRQIRKLVRGELKIKEDSARLHNLMAAFKRVLLADLDEDYFSDMFAQTLTYGFFAAKVHFDGKGEFSRRTAASILPKTNPFLRKLFREFADESLPESLVGAVDEVVELLKKTDVKKILEDFGKLGKNDPVIHFYESFLGAYDPKLKKEMGVFYTPDSVVSYMVKSLDEILVKEFGRKKGLADDKTMVLDPALGTGSFLHKVVDTIHDKVSKGAWDSYVEDCLLDRIFGFEILMAPYAVAHLNLGIQLQETGYQFGKEQRLGVFLTNTLEETAKRSEVLFADWISEEADAAASVKRDKPIMVVVGNPPYQKISTNNGEWINGLMKGYDSVSDRKVENYFEVDGKPLGEKKLWLNDDYIKFIRFAHWRIEQTGHGVLAFITNHGYLDNPTLRGMRESLLNDFDSLYILDLHGNSKKRESTPTGGKDENVFNIQTGVSICFLFRSEGNKNKHRAKGKVYRYDVYGTREEKFEWLAKHTWEKTPFKKIDVRGPDYNFNQIDRSKEDEYQQGISIKEMFDLNNAGFVTACDEMSIQFSENEMWNTVRDFVTNSEEYCRERWGLGGNRDWQVKWAQADAKATGPKKQNLKPVLYRPFDVRWTYYTGKMKGFSCNPRNDVMNHMLDGKNIGLAFTRPQAPSYRFTAFVTDSILDQCAAGNKSAGAGISYLAPLFRIENEKKISNLTPAVATKLNFEATPEEIFYYTYACLQSNSYKERYSEFLKRDYAKVQFTEDKSLFKKLVRLGEEIADVHLLRDKRLMGGKAGFAIKGTNEVEFVKFDSKNDRVYINKDQYFEGVTEYHWKYEFGGYQVLEKWLKDRKGMKLDFDTISRYESLVELINLTDKLAEKIDSVIKDAGGWPLAKEKAPSKKKAA